MAGVDPTLIAAIQADPELLARARVLAEKIIARGEFELVYGEDGSLLSFLRTATPTLREALTDRSDGLDDVRAMVAEIHAEVLAYGGPPASDDDGGNGAQVDAPKPKRTRK